jgi:N-acetylmuramoyl-L-alanine amidase
MLKTGDKGALVEKLQRALTSQKLYQGPVDGVYSSEVEAAVREFQRRNSLSEDGIAGQATMRALGI